MPSKKGLTIGVGRSGEDRASISARERAGAADPLDRIAPHNIDAEEGLIASCIMDGGQETITLCLEARLSPDYFYKPAHQVIFQALLDLYEKGSVVDEIILVEHLGTQDRLEEIGGFSAITHLTNRIETTAHAQYWMEIVREKCLLRRLIKSATQIVDDCYHSQDGLDNFLEAAEQKIFEISQDRVTESAIPIKDSIDSAVKLINTLLQSKGELSGVSSGFIDLDRMTFGLHQSEMIVLAARPSVGKTSLALNIADAATFPSDKQRKPVPTLFFNLEMSASQLAFRLLCSHSKVNMQRVKDGMVAREDQNRLSRDAKALKEAPLWIDESGQLTILEMRAKARRMHAKHKLGLIVVDYLQLISGTDSRVAREQQISEISRGIKAMAKELEVPVLVLSQLNRESEREKRQPRLSDLRESGSIEQDADVVFLLAKRGDKREEGENGNTVPSSGEVIDLIIAKQRNGPVGKVPLSFRPEFTRYENYSDKSI